MRKSWSQQIFTGYEIKVSRSDFMNDDKWPSYLPYCNEFYFVCPTGLIKPDEVGLEAGLMYISKTGTRIFRKKKAPRRQVDQESLASLLQYLMMWRVNPGNPAIETAPGTYDQRYWQKWMKDKQIDRDFGYHVGKAIKVTIKQEIEKVRLQNQKLIDQSVKCDAVREFLKQYNIDVNKSPTYAIKNDLAAVFNAIPNRLIGSMQEVESRLSSCRCVLEALKEKSGNDVQV